jgi:phosphatidylglycerol:prolipoprotein diacylglycerol transferase
MYPRFDGLTWVAPYGLALTAGCVIGWWVTRRRARAAGWDVSHIDLALPLAFVVGAIGVKLLSLLLPTDVGAGATDLAAHGRLRLFALPLFAAPVLVAYGRASRLALGPFLDLLAPSILILPAALRVGCFLAGCCWGDLAAGVPALSDPGAQAQLMTLPSLNAALASTALAFPPGSFAALQHESLGLIPPGAPSLPVLPAQLYESGALVVMLLALPRAERLTRAPGQLASVAVGGYGALRFATEFVRADSALVAGLVTGNQLVCAALVAAAVACWMSLGRGARQPVRPERLDGVGPRSIGSGVPGPQARLENPSAARQDAFVVGQVDDRGERRPADRVDRRDMQ